MPRRLDIRIRFGRAIRRVREKQRINQGEAAERCGLHRTYYSGLEWGVSSGASLKGRSYEFVRDTLTSFIDALRCQSSSTSFLMDSRRASQFFASGEFMPRNVAD
jgi:transcriptional regulator with XRE-family HTH domain